MMMMHGVQQEPEGSGKRTKFDRKTKANHQNVLDVIKEIKERAIWAQIFCLFKKIGGEHGNHINMDADTEPDFHLNREEIKNALITICGETEEVQLSIPTILGRLDSDGGGDIDFQEFLAFASDMSNCSLSPEDISNQMFDLVDHPDNKELDGSESHPGSESQSQESPLDDEEEDEITIMELQTALEKFGQELSADDVYNVIKDIDEDGDGQLNREEFLLLCQKLKVVDKEPE